MFVRCIQVDSALYQQNRHSLVASLASDMQKSVFFLNNNVLSFYDLCELSFDSDKINKKDASQSLLRLMEHPAIVTERQPQHSLASQHWSLLRRDPEELQIPVQRKNKIFVDIIYN